MKRVFLLLVFFSCIYAHAQNFYISGGLGLRIEPFKDLYEELHVNPNFVKNIGIGYRFKNDTFSIQSNFTPIGRNLRFNPSLVASMQYHL